MKQNEIPRQNYGVIFQEISESELDLAIEELRRVGYAVIDSGFSDEKIKKISQEFNSARLNYIGVYGEQNLRTKNEFHTIRALLSNGKLFIDLAMNRNVLSVISKLIVGKFILTQQNGVVNPPNEKYNQGAWHRDLPYQHFVSTNPLAINALFCVDDFTIENGSTYVLPASHLNTKFPSDHYINASATQVLAKAGQFILLDCMTYHSGGFNSTGFERRAINHVYAIPFFKQQISIPNLLKDYDLTIDQKEILGFNYTEPNTINEFLNK